jgi:hypothetical protein
MSIALLNKERHQLEQLKHKGLTAEFVTITPEIAAAWLDKNDGNRRMKTRLKNKYARDMAAGAFVLTGDPIRFSKSGHLIDGQHRLTACVASGVSFQSLVIYGLTEDARQHIDIGMRRSTADVLALAGIPSGSKVAAVVRVALTERSGGLLSRVSWTESEVVAFVKKYPQIFASTRSVYDKIRIRRLPAKMLSYIHFVAVQFMDEEAIANSFVEVFAHGAPTFEHDPAHTWRERLLAQPAGGLAVRGSVGDEVVRRGTIYAWNMFRTRTPMQKFHIPKKAAIDGFDASQI